MSQREPWYVFDKAILNVQISFPQDPNTNPETTNLNIHDFLTNLEQGL